MNSEKLKSAGLWKHPEKSLSRPVQDLAHLFLGKVGRQLQITALLLEVFYPLINSTSVDAESPPKGRGSVFRFNEDEIRWFHVAQRPRFLSGSTATDS